MNSSHNPVVWFEIYVKDMKRAQAFYEKVLGVRLQELPVPAGAGLNGMRAFPSPGPESFGASGALVDMADGPAGGGGSIVYFACADCAVEAGRIAAAGGKVMKDKMSIAPHGFIALGIDTENNVFGLHSMN